MDSARGPSGSGSGDPSAQVTIQARAGGGATNQFGSHETPVIWHQPDFGFKEVHTTVIPTTFYLSMNKLDHKLTALNKLEVRMNSPYKPWVNDGSIVPQGAGAAIAEGPSVTQANNNSNGNSASSLLSFPVTYTTSHKAQWLAWWEKVYQKYTVLETHYEITVTAANDRNTSGFVVFEEQDAYGTSGGNIMPDGDLDEMADWRDVKRHYIDGSKARDNRMDSIKIKGVWKPNQVTRNAFNDGDIQTWINTGAIPGSPAYVESLHLRFFKAPFDSTNIAAGTLTPAWGVNVQVKLRYIVQFRDLDYRMLS